MPPLLPNDIEKMTYEQLCSFLSAILRQEMKITGQTGRGTGRQFRFGDPRLKVR